MGNPSLIIREIREIRGRISLVAACRVASFAHSRGESALPKGRRFQPIRVVRVFRGSNSGPSLWRQSLSPFTRRRLRRQKCKQRPDSLCRHAFPILLRVLRILAASHPSQGRCFRPIRVVRVFRGSNSGPSLWSQSHFTIHRSPFTIQNSNAPLRGKSKIPPFPLFAPV